MQSSIPSEVDVHVVGYGPVGAAVTCLLGQYGVRTLVIDKAPDIFLAPRAIVLDNEALRVLQWVGLPEGAFARLPIPQVRMVCPYLGEFGRFNTSGTLLVMPRNAALALLVHGALKLVRSVPGLREHVDELGFKPKPQFKEGLFVKGRGKLRRGGMLGQVRVRTESGDVRLSDDLLGPALTLVGLGAEVDAQLSPETRRRWASHGGMTLQLEPEVFEDAATIEALPRGWCAVVRPDRTILHDGPASQANRVAREALALLEA